MPYLSKEDKERIARGLMLYKRELNCDQSPDNTIKVEETDNLAERLDLDKNNYVSGVVI
jgi:hypothetical protein